MQVVLVELLPHKISERICWLPLSLLDSPKLSSVVHVSSLGLSCFHQFLNFLLSFSQLLQWLSLELIKFVGSFSQLRSP